MMVDHSTLKLASDEEVDMWGTAWAAGWGGGVQDGRLSMATLCVEDEDGQLWRMRGVWEMAGKGKGKGKGKGLEGGGGGDGRDGSTGGGGGGQGGGSVNGGGDAKRKRGRRLRR